MTLVNRLLTAIIALFVSSVIVFGALYLAPGSPIDALLGGANPTEQQIADLNAQYGLDRPFSERYGIWLGNILSGDLGRSIVYSQDVSSLIQQRIATSGLLIGYALLLSVVMGVVWGAIGAVRGGKTDTTVIVTTSMAAATPPFVAAILFIAIFSVRAGWFPVQGAGTGLWDRLWHLTLPAFSLAFSLAALIGRVTRTSFIEELGSEHVMTARGRGFTSRHVLRRHVGRNSLIPIVTITGLVAAYLITGTIVVEKVFALSGIGTLLIEAVDRSDYPVVQAIALIVVVAFIVVNALVDVFYVAIDPRLRHATQAS